MFENYDGAGAGAPNLTENAIKVLEKRYLKRDEGGKLIETPQGLFIRVAEAVASAESTYGADPAYWAGAFYKIMADMDFMPNSPTLMNAGTQNGQLSACFVLPIGDSMNDIFDSLKATALVHKSGGGTGFNFSALRPAGDTVKSTSGVASGPLSFLDLFDKATDVVKQGGTRRGANMGILAASHPDIFEFIKAKTAPGRMTNFNISVGIDEPFLAAVRADAPWKLLNPRTGDVVRSVMARELWDLLIQSAWQTGDPGIIFLDRIEQHNPTPHVGRMNSVNPCGEQPLLPYESCNLGSINLANMLDKAGNIDYPKLERTVKTAVRFLDNVIDTNVYPLDKIKEMSLANRKIGLGIMGWAEVLFAKKLRYGSNESLKLAGDIMAFIRRTGHETSEALAIERGVFPNWEGSTFSTGEQSIKMRNATITTIAPTGTISLIAGCSSGIEPVFALAMRRKAFDSDTFIMVNPIFERDLSDIGQTGRRILERVLETGSLEGADAPLWMRETYVTAHDIPYEDHVRMQAAFQQHTDNAVSKTINLPHEASPEQVENAYLLAYETGCKGITVYRDRCKETQVLYMGTGDGAALPTGSHPEVSKTHIKRRRPAALTGTTIKINTSFGNLYLTMNRMDGKPFELFATLGKSGKDTQAHTEALGRLVSLALRSGISFQEIIGQLKGIGGSQPVFEGDGIILSLPDAIAQGMERAIGETVELVSRDMCPSCGGALVRAEGCLRCMSCDYSKCM